MNALFEWIFKQISALWPLTIVEEWRCAFLLRNGIIIKDLTPGLHWRWLFIEKIITFPKSECGLDLGTSAIITRDGKSVVISANLGYRVTDLALNYRKLWHSENSLAKLALGRMASHCAGMSLEELQNRVLTENQILENLNSMVCEWGLEIPRFHLTDCVTARSLRHYIDGMSQKVE